MTRGMIPWSTTRDIEGFLEDFGLGRFGGEFAPAIDVYQDNDHVIAEVAVTGMNPEKVDITIENDVLTIGGHVEDKKEVKREDYYRKEIRSGAFMRSVILPMQVKGDEAEAHYEKGVLKIVMPKAEEAKPKKIVVKVQ